MKISERGFIISRVNYSESSLIVRCYTQQQGLKAFLFQGAKKKHGHVLMALAPIEFNCYQRNDSQLSKMTDVQLFYAFQEIPFHPVKSGILFFMAEILQNVLHEDVKDEVLFEFISDEIKWLDHTTIYTNYPVFWLLELTQHLGFYPLLKPGNYFDLEEGVFSEVKPINHTYLQGEIVQLLQELIQLEKDKIMAYPLKKTERKQLITLLLDYYKFHLPNFRKIKSMEVVESIWND